MTDLFDFGFTAVDEDELQAVQQTAAKADNAEQLATTTQERLDNLYNTVIPLLNNLKRIRKKNTSYGQIDWLRLKSLKLTYS